MKKILNLLVLLIPLVLCSQSRELKIFERVKLDESPDPNYEINEIPVQYEFDVFIVSSKSNPRAYILDAMGLEKITYNGIEYKLIQVDKFVLTQEKIKLGRRTFRLQIFSETGEYNFEIVEFVKKE